MDPNLKSDDNCASGTPSTALLNQRLGTSPTLRMFTPSEVELLQRSKEEVREHVSRVLANKDDSAGV